MLIHDGDDGDGTSEFDDDLSPSTSSLHSTIEESLLSFEHYEAIDSFREYTQERSCQINHDCFVRVPKDSVRYRYEQQYSQQKQQETIPLELASGLRRPKESPQLPIILEGCRNVYHLMTKHGHEQLPFHDPHQIAILNNPQLGQNHAVIYYLLQKIGSTMNEGKRKEHCGKDKAVFFVSILDIHQMCKSLDLNVQIMVRAILSYYLELFPVQTSIPIPNNDNKSAFPFPVSHLFEFALGSGEMVRGIMLKLVLLMIESGAQKQYGIENSRSSMHEWLSYDLKSFYQGKLYIEQPSISMHEETFTEEERQHISTGKIKLLKYGFISWPPNIPLPNIPLSPMLFHVMLGQFEDLIDAYKDPAVTNPTTSKEMYSKDFTDAQHDDADDTILTVATHLEQSEIDMMVLFDRNNTTLINKTKQLSFKGFSLTGQKVPRNAHFIQY